MSSQLPEAFFTSSTSTPPPPPPRPPSSLSPPTGEDVVAQITGHFGRWQLRTVLLVFLCKIPTAWFMACVIYTAPTPQKGDYYCKPSPPPPPASNVSHQLGWVRMSYPVTDERRTDRRFHVDACNIYEERLEQDWVARYANYTSPFEQPAAGDTVKVDVIPCQQFEHNSDYKSLVTQFDLVCSRQLLVSVTQSFHAIGALVGGLLALQALKHFSPRRLMLVGMLFQIVCGNLTGLVSTFPLHVFFRCVTSCFCTLMYTSGQVIPDITDGKAKTIVTTLYELFWSIGLILLPGISIFFDSWSYLYVVISSSVVVLVFLHRWISDSPRWLLRHKKIDRSLRILLESAAFNNRPVPLNLVPRLEAYAEELQGQGQPNYWSIWDGKTKRVFISLVHLTWVGTAVPYNVMLLMIRQLGVSHIHVNTVGMGFAEMMGILLGLVLILYTRRRWLWCGYLTLVAGLLTHLVWFVPTTIKENRRVGMQLIFWICLKLANSASLSVLSTCTGEMVSPQKRAILMTSATTFSRIWLVFAPFISTLTVFHELIPITTFALMALLNGGLMCCLNRSFWNQEQPRIEKVLTPNTYRRNSAILLLRRSSTCSELSTGHTTFNGYENPMLTISISDLWKSADDRFDTIAEYDSSHEIETMKETINF